MTDYTGRIERARQAMAEADIDAMLLSVGSDLPYLTGYAAPQTERLTMLVLTSDGADLVVPRLEAPRVERGPFELVVWEETQDPISLVAAATHGAGRIAIGTRTWSVFTLAIQSRVGAEFVPASHVMTGLRIRKDQSEIGFLRQAAEAADRVAERLARAAFSGLTERQLAHRVAQWTVDEGHDTATFTVVAAGPNGASPHHEPGTREIAPGDVVVIDFGGTVRGYGSDTTRTFTVGPASPRQAEVHGVVQSARDRALAAVKPGVPAEAIDDAARSVIVDAGYGDYFIHRTGHGIGLDGHEDPFLVAGNDSPVEEGMTFSIEPGIYLPGEFGVRIEDIVLVTPTAGESLNRSDRSLRQVG